MLGTTMPNCDRLDCSADMISPGRSVTIAACTKSCFSGAGCGLAVNAVTAVTANGLATATAATALKAVESLRRRLFGTEVSSIWTTIVWVVGATGVSTCGRRSFARQYQRV